MHARRILFLFALVRAAQLRQRDHGNAGLLRQRVEAHGDLRDLFKALQALILRGDDLQIIDKDHLVVVRDAVALDILNRHAGCLDLVQRQLADSRRCIRCLLPLPRIHGVCLDSLQGNPGLLRHHAVRQLFR